MSKSSEPSAVIEAAIVRLEELRGDGNPWVMAGGNEWINPIGITVAPDDGGVSSREADLIVTLHRTIDAQLAILRDWIFHAEVSTFTTNESKHVLALARSILGEADR